MAEIVGFKCGKRTSGEKAEKKISKRACNVYKEFQVVAQIASP